MVFSTLSHLECSRDGSTHDALWRCHELLPVRDPAHVVTLGEGTTPLLALPRHGARLGVPGLRMKDEAPPSP